MRKLAEATAVPFPDSSADTAAAAPIPGLSVGNKPAPGQRGPKGLAPRTNYSRVNTGSPNPVDVGASSQKGAPPDTQNFLPSKIAHREVPMSGPMTPRTTLQELIKAAAVGASEHVSVSMEAARQLANSGETAPVKTASAVGDGVDSIPTSYVNKLAGACEYWLNDLRKEAEDGQLGPGTGPNATEVLEATSENNEFKSGNQGQATPAHVVPMTPGTHKPAETPAGPANALDTNAAHPVGGTQKTSGVTAAELRKAASVASAMSGLKGVGERAGGIAKGVGGHIVANKGKYLAGAGIAGAAGLGGAALAKKKESSALDPRLVDYFLSMTKSAEDAINPAQISAGKAEAPVTDIAEGIQGAGTGGGAVGFPAGGAPEGPRGLVGSNESAINYTKGQAKAPMKAQLAAVVSEPALSAAHDTTLNKAWDATGAAGVKISHSLRHAAARAVLEKMAEAACAKETKKKVSAGMSNFTAPQVTGAAAGPM